MIGLDFLPATRDLVELVFVMLLAALWFLGDYVALKAILRGDFATMKGWGELLEEEPPPFLTRVGRLLSLGGGFATLLLILAVPGTSAAVGLVTGGVAGYLTGRWLVAQWERDKALQEPLFFRYVRQKLASSVPFQLFIFVGMPVAFGLLIFLLGLARISHQGIEKRLSLQA